LAICFTKRELFLFFAFWQKQSQKKTKIRKMKNKTLAISGDVVGFFFGPSAFFLLLFQFCDGTKRIVSKKKKPNLVINDI
jgi:hypothetical protein